MVGYSISTLAPSTNWLRYSMVIFGILDAAIYTFVITIALGIYSFMILLLVSVAPNLLILLGVSINGWRCKATPEEGDPEAATMLGARRLTIAYVVHHPATLCYCPNAPPPHRSAAPPPHRPTTLLPHRPNAPLPHRSTALCPLSPIHMATLPLPLPSPFSTLATLHHGFAFP